MAAQPCSFLVADRLAGLDRLADRDERPVGGQREWWRAEAVQLAQQVAQVGGARCRAVLGEVPPERDRAAVAEHRLVDGQRLDGGEAGCAEPSGDSYRGLQAGDGLRRGHHGDPGDGIGGREVVHGGGEQAHQLRVGVVEVRASGRVRQSLGCYLGKVGCGHKEIMPMLHRLIGRGEVMFTALNAVSWRLMSAAAWELRKAGPRSSSRHASMCSFRLLIRRPGSRRSRPVMASAAASASPRMRRAVASWTWARASQP